MTGPNGQGVADAAPWMALPPDLGQPVPDTEAWHDTAGAEGALLNDGWPLDGATENHGEWPDTASLVDAAEPTTGSLDAAALSEAVTTDLGVIAPLPHLGAASSTTGLAIADAAAPATTPAGYAGRAAAHASADLLPAPFSSSLVAPLAAATVKAQSRPRVLAGPTLSTAAAVQQAARFAADVLSGDEDTPQRRLDALHAYTADPATIEPSYGAARGRQRVDLVLPPGRVVRLVDGAVLVEMTVRVVTYHRLAAPPPDYPLDAGPAKFLGGAAAPAPPQPGWLEGPAYWVGLAVAVRRDPTHRIVADLHDPATNSTTDDTTTATRAG